MRMHTATVRRTTRRDRWRDGCCTRELLLLILVPLLCLLSVGTAYASIEEMQERRAELEEHREEMREARERRMLYTRDVDLRAWKPPPPPRPKVTQTRALPTGGDFWAALSGCESPTGKVGAHVGYFQFSWDTAAKVGINGSESYEEQRAAAQRWLQMINGQGGTRSGWPHCWWVAKAETGGP